MAKPNFHAAELLILQASVSGNPYAGASVPLVSHTCMVRLCTHDSLRRYVFPTSEQSSKESHVAYVLKAFAVKSRLFIAENSSNVSYSLLLYSAGML